MKNQEYFGIFINDKIPKIKDKKDKFNKYYRNIKLDFKGKVYIINKKNEKTELKTNSKFKKSGKYIIQFINENNEVYYINIHIIKLLPLLWFFFMTICILLSFILFDKFIDTTYEMTRNLNFDAELEGIKYVFNVNYENQNFKNIKLTDKVTQSNFLYPGSYGSFYILISTKDGNKDIDYWMEVKEESNKPINLKFKINNIEYDSITELSKDIKGVISKDSNKILKIDFFWDYDSNDLIDTTDGMNLENYKFLIRIVGNEHIERGGIKFEN